MAIERAVKKWGSSHDGRYNVNNSLEKCDDDYREGHYCSRICEMLWLEIVCVWMGKRRSTRDVLPVVLFTPPDAFPKLSLNQPVI